MTTHNVSSISQNLNPGAFGLPDMALLVISAVFIFFLIAPAAYSLFYLWRKNRAEDRAEVRNLPGTSEKTPSELNNIQKREEQKKTA
jgi:hypothetical protein